MSGTHLSDELESLRKTVEEFAHEVVAPTIGAVTPGLCRSQASASPAAETPRSAASSAARSMTGKSSSGR